MYTYVNRKQFEFERLKNGNLYVTFRPFSSKFEKKQFSVLFTTRAEYYHLAISVYVNACNDFEMRHLADFVETYDGQTI